MVKSLMREVEERVRDLDEAFREVLKEDNGLPLVEQKKLIRSQLPMSRRDLI